MTLPRSSQGATQSRTMEVVLLWAGGLLGMIISGLYALAYAAQGDALLFAVMWTTAVVCGLLLLVAGRMYEA